MNSVRPRLEHLQTVLRDQKIDIALLQETKVEDHAFPAQPLEDMGYNVAIHGQKSYNGVAILSRFPLEDVQKGLPGQPSDQARFIQAWTGGVLVASIYVPNGDNLNHPVKFPQKRDFFTALDRYLASLSSFDSLVWGGDYNVAPSCFDVYDSTLWKSRILCSTDERLWFRRLLARGLSDTLDSRPLDPDAKNPFTWWDYRTRGFENGRGLRIDHMLVSPPVLQRTQSIKVYDQTRGWERPSDHAPVILELKPTA